MPPISFDSLAAPYEWLERLTFGPYLQRCRIAMLDRVGQVRSALIVGDGDGRFLEALLKANPEVTVDSLDISPAMIAKARSRCDHNRVRFQVADARAHDFGAERYDLIVTNFFLDCFEESDLEVLIPKLSTALKPGGLWIVGDFRVPDHRLLRPLAQFALAGMYLFFKVATRIPASRLVNPAPLLRSLGLVETQTQRTLGGFLQSSLWNK